MRVTLQRFIPRQHTELIEYWLWLPHVSEWWLHPERQLASCVEPKPAGAGHRIIAVDDMPVGYLRYEYLTSGDLSPYIDVAVPQATVDVDIFIGEEAYLGRGVGPISLELLERELVDSEDSDVSGICLAVSIHNHRAVNAYQKVGYSRIAEFNGNDYGELYLMYKILENAPTRNR